MRKHALAGFVAVVTLLVATPVFAATINVSGHVTGSVTGLTASNFTAKIDGTPQTATFGFNTASPTSPQYNVSLSVPTGLHTITIGVGQSGGGATASTSVTITVTSTTGTLSLTIDAPLNNAFCDDFGCMGGNNTTSSSSSSSSSSSGF